MSDVRQQLLNLLGQEILDQFYEDLNKLCEGYEAKMLSRFQGIFSDVTGDQGYLSTVNKSVEISVRPDVVLHIGPWSSYSLSNKPRKKRNVNGS